VSKNVPLPTGFQKVNPASVDDLRGMERHVETLVAKVSAAVVAVSLDGGAGSGVVVSSNGFVLCAAHVCGQPGRKVLFTFPNGRKALGITLGTNHDMDAALMKISDPGIWPYVELTNPGAAHLGDWVLALGHPGGFDPDRPVVARLGRIVRTSPLLQTDCTLIGGDSGGPLFDMRGHIIGIHSRISVSTSENYHVPIDAFLNNWERLMKGDNWGESNLAMLPTIGAGAVNDPKGCRLERVREGGPSAKAGLQVGDLVLRIQNEPIADSDAFSRSIRQTRPGDEIAVLVSRAGREMSMTVKVEARTGWNGRGRRSGTGP
jgi:serine protease Do